MGLRALTAPGRCWLCGEPLPPGSHNREICGEPDCVQASNVLEGQARRYREAKQAAKHCRWCQADRAKGSAFCESHQWRKELCTTPGCQGRVRRGEGRGAPHRHCEACKRARRPERTEGAGLITRVPLSGHCWKPEED